MRDSACPRRCLVANVRHIASDSIGLNRRGEASMSLRYYSTEEVAELLGVNGNTIRRKIHAGEIRWSNIGTPERPRVRISEDDLKSWMDAQASRPAKRSA